MNRSPVKDGEFFAIPFDEQRVGYGQVVSLNPVLPNFVYIFEPLFASHATFNPNMVHEASVLLSANTFDALFVNGRWRVVGSREIDECSVLLPQFKVLQDGKWMVENCFGTSMTQATPGQTKVLSFRTVTSPMNLECAFKAHHGVGRWLPGYDSLLFKRMQESAITLYEARKRH